MTVNQGKLRRRRDDVPDGPPLPVDPSHPCWCERFAHHRIGDHPTFWASPPPQGVQYPQERTA